MLGRASSLPLRLRLELLPELSTGAVATFCFFALGAILKEIVAFESSARGKGGLGIEDSTGKASGDAL